MRRCVRPLICCMLAGCIGPPAERPAPATAFPAFAADEFPGAAALLDGFDERTDDGEWRAHDRVLFGLRLDRGGVVTRWLLLIDAPLGSAMVATSSDGSELSLAVGALATWRFEVPDGAGKREIRVESRLASANAKVFTAAGDLLTDTAESLPVDLLVHGLLPAIEPARDAAARGETPHADRAMVEGVLTVQHLLELVQGNEALADYFWQVVDKPSVWSVLMHFGVEVHVSVPLEQSVPADAPSPIPPAEPTFVLPMRIDVNGSPALFVDLMATDSRRPFALCGGIVAAIARHPTEPSTTLRMQLLAARCGAVARARIVVKTGASR